MPKRTPEQKAKLKRLIKQLKDLRKYPWMTFAPIAFVIVSIGVGGLLLSWNGLNQGTVGQNLASGNKLVELPQTGSDTSDTNKNMVKVQSVFNLTITSNAKCNTATQKYMVVQELRSNETQKLLQTLTTKIGTNYDTVQVLHNEFDPVDSDLTSNDFNITYLVSAQDTLDKSSKVLNSSNQKVTGPSYRAESSISIPCFTEAF